MHRQRLGNELRKVRVGGLRDWSGAHVGTVHKGNKIKSFAFSLDNFLNEMNINEIRKKWWNVIEIPKLHSCGEHFSIACSI